MSSCVSGIARCFSERARGAAPEDRGARLSGGGRPAAPPPPASSAWRTSRSPTPSVPGRLDIRNARYVLALLDLAIDGALTGEFAALVTAPVQKGLLNDAGIAFTGHTEYLATRVGGGPPVMLLTAGELRVALATTHLPLRAVSAALSVDSLCHTAATLAQALESWWGIACATHRRVRLKSARRRGRPPGR